MPSTEVILTDNVPGLGAEADVVKVRRGYARNYLLPRGKAYEVTPAALRQLDTLKKKRAEREARELNEAEELARRIGKAHLTFTLATGESGKAFGSITAQDIVTRMKNELGLEIDRHKIVLERPINVFQKKKRNQINGDSTVLADWGDASQRFGQWARPRQTGRKRRKSFSHVAHRFCAGYSPRTAS